MPLLKHNDLLLSVARPGKGRLPQLSRFVRRGGHAHFRFMIRTRSELIRKRKYKCSQDWHLGAYEDREYLTARFSNGEFLRSRLMLPQKSSVIASECFEQL